MAISHIIKRLLDLCEYCALHGAGKKWYQNAENISKKLARSDLVKDFCEGYFSRERVANTWNPSEYLFLPVEENEREQINNRYKKYLHHQVVSSEEAFDILKLANYHTDDHEHTVVRLPCVCRYTGYGSDPDLSCFGIAFTDEYTRKFPKYLGGTHRYVSTGEAVESLEMMISDNPIVHAVSALGVPYLGMLCNCDMSVCRPYYHRLRLGINSPFYKGHNAAQIDRQKCVNCGKCQEVCPFDVPYTCNDGTVVIDAELCYGCGVCVRNCPENAIHLLIAIRKTGY